MEILAEFVCNRLGFHSIIYKLKEGQRYTEMKLYSPRHRDLDLYLNITQILQELGLLIYIKRHSTLILLLRQIHFKIFVRLFHSNMTIR